MVSPTCRIPQCDQEPGQGRFAGAFKTRDQIGRRFLTHSFQTLELFFAHFEEIGESFDKTRIHKLVDQFFSQAVDIPGLPDSPCVAGCSSAARDSLYWGSG